MVRDFLVRPFRPADARAVVSLWQEVLPSTNAWNEPNQELARKLAQSDELVFVGELGGSIVSVIMAGYDGLRGWVYRLAVAPSVRRHGYGRQTLQAAEKALQQRGCPKINLQVRGDNLEVIEFYRACGYAVEERASLGKLLPAPSPHVLPTIQVNHQIKLSSLTEHDKPDLLQCLNESRDISQHMLSMPFPYTPVDADVWITKTSNPILDLDRANHWAIRNVNEQVIGGIGLIDLTPGQRAEVGYWLAKPYWGRGIMTLCVRSLCDFAFDQHHLRRIYAKVLSPNVGSVRVLEKSDFVLEGTLRDHHFLTDQHVDVLVYARLHGA